MSIARTVAFLGLLLLIGAAAPTGAQWIQNGTKALDDHGMIRFFRAVPDGKGGVYLATQARSALPATTPEDIILQHVDVHGRRGFSTGGYMVELGASNPDYLSLGMAVDEDGNAWLATHCAQHGGYFRILVRGLDSAGNPVGYFGYATDNTYNSYNPVLAYDASLKAFFVAHTVGSGQLHVRRYFRDSGTTGVWNSYNLPGATVTIPTYAYQVIPDGAAGCIVVWIDSRSGNNDIFAQRLGPTGLVQWTAGGVRVCDLPSVPNDFKAIGDGEGGVYVTWSDNRDGTQRIYAQRITAAGTEAWTADGVPVCSVVATQFEPVAGGDGSGGLIVAWRDYRTGHWDLMGQRLNGSGYALWPASGAILCGVNSSKYGLSMVADGAGGAVLSWHDFRNGGADIYAQRFDVNGGLLWAADGVALCTDPAAQQYPLLVSDGAGGAVAAWKDPRIAADDYFVQRVDRFGNWGFPAGVVQAVSDAPADQGGRVVVGWDRSRFDDWSVNKVGRYTVWREIDLKAGAAAAVADPDLAAKSAAPLRIGAADKASYWEKVGEVEAVANPGYAMTVPTLRDSTAADPAVVAFRVIAHGSVPGEYWVSLPLSGWSVDNLAPLAPVGFAGQASYEPAGLDLVWLHNTESDLSGYRLYRGADASFVPGPSSLVAALADSVHFDAGWSPGSHYKLTAVDVHGNEGPWIALAPDAVSAVGAVPGATALLGGAPNPFNPTTTIRFALAQASRVTLRIYDTRGRLVRELASGEYPAGTHAETWDGRTVTGEGAASGVYHCRFVGDGIVQTRAVTLLK